MPAFRAEHPDDKCLKDSPVYIECHANASGGSGVICFGRTDGQKERIQQVWFSDVAGGVQKNERLQPHKNEAHK